MRKSFFAALLTMIIAICMLPSVVCAEDNNYTMDFTLTSASWGGLESKDLTTQDASGTGWSWDADNKRLTLSSLNFTTTNSTAMKLPGGSTVIMNGVSTITSTFSGVSSSFGIDCASNLTFEGAGTLTVTSGTARSSETESFYSYGINMDSGVLKFSSGSVTAQSDTTGNCEIVAGVNTEDGKVEVAGGTLIAKGGNATYRSYGIYTTHGIVINRGSVTATSGSLPEDGFFSTGIYANDREGITVNSGTLYAAADTTVNASYNLSMYLAFGDIEAHPDATITGSATVDGEMTTAEIGVSPARPDDTNKCTVVLNNGGITSDTMKAKIETPAPSALPAPSNPTWGSGATEGKVSWDSVPNSSEYRVQLYKGGTGDSNKIGGELSETSLSKDFKADMIANGVGKYYFKVRALTSNVAYDDGEWATSTAYDLTDIAVTDITLTSDENAIVNKDIQLTASITPTTATKKNITWAMEDPEGTEATVTSSGMFRATKVGYAKVKATIEGGAAGGSDYTKSIYIRVIDPLTFTAEEDNSSVTLNWSYSEDTQVNINGAGWKDYSAGTTITLAKRGDTVRFKGNKVITDMGSHFRMTGKIAASGDVTSLKNQIGGDIPLNQDNFPYMFYECTSLTTAPELPSTSVHIQAYKSMFEGCTSLKIAPELPAVNLETGAI